MTFLNVYEQYEDYRFTNQKIILIHQQLCKILFATDDWHQLSTLCSCPHKSIHPFKAKDCG